MIEMSHGQSDLCWMVYPTYPVLENETSDGVPLPRGEVGLNVSLLKPLSKKN